MDTYPSTPEGNALRRDFAIRYAFKLAHDSLDIHPIGAYRPRYPTPKFVVIGRGVPYESKAERLARDGAK